MLKILGWNYGLLETTFSHMVCCSRTKYGPQDQDRDGLISKIWWQKNNNSIFERLSKLEAAKNISQLHMLVDFKYLFFGKLVGLEIWCTCY